MMNKDELNNISTKDIQTAEFFRIILDISKELLNSRHYEISSVIQNSLRYIGYFFNAEVMQVYIMGNTEIQEVIKWSNKDKEVGELVFDEQVLGDLYDGCISIHDTENYKKCFANYSAEDSLKILFPMELFESIIGVVFIDMGTKNDEICKENEFVKMVTLIANIFSATISRRHRINELFNVDEIHRIAMSSIDEMIITTNHQGEIIYVNSKVVEVFGKQIYEFTGKVFSEVITLINKTYNEPCEDLITEMIVMEQLNNFDDDFMITGKNEEQLIVKCELAPVYNINSEYFGAVISLFDITDKKAKEEKLHFLSRHDKLTGLYNRSYLEEMMIKLDNEENYPMSVVVGDINGLKLVNSAFGKEMGDELLIQVSEAMKRIFRENGIICRVRGNMFIIILPNTSREMVENYIGDITGYIMETNYLPIDVSVSFGYACTENSDRSISELVNLAEEEVGVRKAIESKGARDKIIDGLIENLMVSTHETQEHGDKIAYYSELIAKKMGLSEDEIQDLMLLAYVHDIGKVTIPEHILNKKGELSNDEWRILKNHVYTGYQIAMETRKLFKVAQEILSHHEKWDGSGYPQNLKGKQIPLLARIIAVADGFDSMMTDRSYRAAMSYEEVIKVIEEGASKAYDPEVVEVFQEVLDELGEF